MEFNKIEDLLKNTKAPKLPVSNNKTTDMKEFIEELKANDIRNAKANKRFNSIYIIVVIFYILLFIVNPDKGLVWQERLIGLCIIGALLVFVYYFKNAKKAFQVQYLVKPTILFLQDAEKRYQFWNKKNLILIPPMLLIDLAASFTFFTNYYPNEKSMLFAIIISQVLFLIICFSSLWIGEKTWKKRNGSIYENIVILLDSFREDTSENTQ